jgi:hypothetical protein
MKKIIKTLTLLVVLTISNVAITSANENEPLLTPNIVQIESLQLYEENNYNYLVDWAFLFPQLNMSRYIEDIDGNMTFKGETIKVGILLPSVLGNDYESYNGLYESIASLYDSDLNTRINEKLVEEISKLYLDQEDRDFFNNAPLEFITEYLPYDNYYTSKDYYRLGGDDCYRDITQASTNYDMLIAPACLFDYDGNWRTDLTMTVFGYYSRANLLQLVKDEDSLKEREYLELVTSNPTQLSWLKVSEGGPICSLNNISNIKIDSAIIQKWDAYYAPTLFESVNELFIDITQTNESNCYYLILTLEDKEKLKSALLRKEFIFEDSLELVDESNLNLDYINNFYAKIDINNEEFYNFFIDMSRDQTLFEKLAIYSIDNQEKLNSLIDKINDEAPSLSGGSNQEIYDYLILSEEASKKGISVANLIAQKEDERIEAERIAAENRALEAQQYAKDYPYYAVISCNVYGSQTALAACFAGFDYAPDTTIELTANGRTIEKKHWEFDALGGYYNYDQYIIDLPQVYDIRAQNASDTMTLKLEIYDQATNNLLYSEEAASQFDVVSSYNY